MPFAAERSKCRAVNLYYRINFWGVVIKNPRNLDVPSYLKREESKKYLILDSRANEIKRVQRYSPFKSSNMPDEFNSVL